MKQLKNVIKIVVLILVIIVAGYFIFTFGNLGAAA